MRTIISGKVTDEILDSADLIGGISPSSYVTNGLSAAPLTPHPERVFPVDKKLGHYGEDARDYTLCQHADAAIIVGRNYHLEKIARQYGLVVYTE